MEASKKRIAAIIAAVYKTAISAVKAFFEISSEDNANTGSKKVAVSVARRLVYVVLDYWVSFASAGMVGLLKYMGLSFLLIVLVTWAFDFIIATIFMVVSEKSGQDITFGESYRRAADVVHSSSRFAGYLTFIYLNVKAVIWDGPEQVVIFFKKEIGSMPRMIGVLIGLTLVQGIFWAWVYSLGYDSVSELIKNLF